MSVYYLRVVDLWMSCPTDPPPSTPRRRGGAGLGMSTNRLLSGIKRSSMQTSGDDSASSLPDDSMDGDGEADA